MAFVASDYWDVTGTFGPDAEQFTAKVQTVDGARVATGSDFADDGTLKPRSKSATILTEASARVFLVQVLGSTPATVTSLESKPYTRRPAAPSPPPLAAAGGQPLRLGARQAMRVAQSLYENGHITYMRTDSVTLSGEAIRASRAQASEPYGSQFVPTSPASTRTSRSPRRRRTRRSGPPATTSAPRRRRRAALRRRVPPLRSGIWKRTVARRWPTRRAPPPPSS